MIYHAYKDDNYQYTIRIPWKHGDTVNSWDETCIWAVEQFGLPGNKFITHPTEEFMDFMFKDKEDAIHFSLVWE
jgi:hypothetical protein